jgi:uncharacterized protein (DUF1800 family)
MFQRPGSSTDFAISRWAARVTRVGSCGVLLAALLSGCGGGSAPSSDAAIDPQAARSVSASATPATDAEAYRFLTQATFGPTAEDLARVKSIGYARWIDEQWSLQLGTTHLSTVEASASVMQTGWPRAEDVVYSWWTHAVRDPAQLRQRVAFALSEIFVVSTVSLENGRNVASYLDMLTTHADGRYRDLLEAVTLHPAMGQYLSHLTNRKADAASGRVPDENFAREVMQLFSIGLYELNDAGRPKLANGAPIESYSASDIKGLARVFTGASWYRPPEKASLAWYRCFWHASDCQDPLQDVTSMSLYAEAHEPGEKSFLGVTLAAGSVANPAADFKAALDRLASHPNTAPFISRQLIQRLVTSNPSDQYVSDITTVFRNSGGNLGQVVKAILLHTEARNAPSGLNGQQYGKLREPVLRMTHLLRALPHRSDRYETNLGAGTTPFYVVDDTSDPGTALGQSPMRSPSVFNFFRPGYVPPQTAFSDANLVAPEMQITSETSVLGYANFVAASLNDGFGRWNGALQRRDIQFDYSKWDNLAGNPTSLVSAVATALLGHALPADVQDSIVAAIQAMPQNSNTQKRQRIQAAFLAVAVSPDFIVQQ